MDSHQMNPYALGGGNNFPVVIRPPLRGNSMTASSEMFYQALTTGYPVTILINQPGYPMPANPSVQQPPAYLGLPASPQSAANVPTSAPARITLRDSNNNQVYFRWPS
ncbi:hypothetical protein QR680_007559 [Steinernema hermaphroditum]|uniref:Uncharacterized protein n=1 Tax=Steinernema hermaphroditum TaxID=289476 RepID=A0AA39IFQ5_9BILA|nr:hypothetical protein QR680_007559 [Steinernema hermaphroditum]